ncbi:DUF1800 family protein [Actinomyces marmotae]|uniref:DUF1800 family protein n=2 Tax=Actinomyces marmotae TaxID=2737173 RepID=A0A6M8BBK2_9ACTO|nr:DUF1800 family protein [Actinomyces marmotae]
MSDGPAPAGPRHAGGGTASTVGSRRVALAALSTAAVGAVGGLSALLWESGPGSSSSAAAMGGPASGEGGPLALPDALKRTVAGGDEGDAGDTSPDPSAAGSGTNDADGASGVRGAGGARDGSGVSDDGAQAASPAQAGTGGAAQAGGTAQAGAGAAGANSGEAPFSSGSGSAPETAKTDALDVYRKAPGTADLEASSGLAPGLRLRTSSAWHLARRASIAATAEIASDIETMGATAWIDRQLAPEGIDDTYAESLVSRHYGWSRLSALEIKRITGDHSAKASPSVINAALTRMRFGNRVLAESVVELMADHVYVPIHGKGEPFITEFDVLLRKHALGRYADLLYAAVTNAALLRELDNTASTKDNPNENLGRELLELYTVGRDSYSEEDVKASTRILTGNGNDWTTMSYVYRPEQHAVGSVDVLGFSDANTDASAGQRMLKRYVEHLCHLRPTALRLAKRIARRYIADEPSDAAVEAIAKAYLDNDTSIASAVKAALTHPDFAASVGRKWRRPTEFYMTIARAAHARVAVAHGDVNVGDYFNLGTYGWLIKEAGHEPRMYGTVDGYPDTAEYWMSAGITMALWNGAQNAVDGDKRESGRTDWPTALSIAAGQPALETARRITWHLTGYAWADAELSGVAEVLAGLPGTGTAATWTVTDKHLPAFAEHAVRLCFCSPYALLR